MCCGVVLELFATMVCNLINLIYGELNYKDDQLTITCKDDQLTITC